MIESLFMTMFDGLKTRYAAELEAVQGQYPFTPIQAKPLRLTFAGGDSRLCVMWRGALDTYSMRCCPGWISHLVASAPASYSYATHVSGVRHGALGLCV